jgi:hypothetical protein
MKTNKLFQNFGISILLLWQINTFAQLGIKETYTVPNTKAMLDVEGSNKGVLIPRSLQFQQLPFTNIIAIFSTYYFN